MRHAVPLQSGMEPFPGYRLRKLLGYGSFAEVWETQASDGSLLALKFLPAEREGAAPAELRSLQSIRQLCHPHLTHVHRVWCHLGYIIVAMELADGSLADLRNTYKEQFGSEIIPEHVCLLLSQAATALDYLNTQQHQLGGKRVMIQHRDIKPSNLLLFGETVKLADFGLASTMTGWVVPQSPAGTPDYAPPETYRGRLTRYSDQYSLAVSYCELRGGRLPFPGRPRMFHPNYNPPPPDLSMLPPEERPILARALASIPEERWPTCCDLVDQLARLLV